MSSYSVDDLSQHPRAIIGPRFVTAIIQGLESGLIVNLAYRFWKDDFAETTIIKVIVIFVTTLSFAQTALTFHVVYDSLILNFADWAQLLTTTPGNADLVMIILLAMPPKAVFVWRCWKVRYFANLLLGAGSTRLTAVQLVGDRSRHIILAILSALWFGSIATASLLIYKVYTGDNARHTPNDPYREISYRTHVNSHMELTLFCAALDVGVFCTITYNTLPLRPQIFTKSITTSVYRFFFVIWESTFPPCACLSLALVMYLTTIRTSLWANFFFSIAGQLYVISLFTVLCVFPPLLSVLHSQLTASDCLLRMGVQAATGGHARHGCAASWSMDPAAVTQGREVDNPISPNFELRELPASSRSSTVSDDVRAGPGRGAARAKSRVRGPRADTVPEPDADMKSPTFRTLD
ncbi:hypothetical protein M0805_005507 [Coniferiporia weirii]|nr:hypothetical protein M0805_005507 [Coniferiporia weirii]